MLLIRMYYLARPFIPRRLRLALRRRHASGVVKNCNGSWPIRESAGKKPSDWQGWPESKQFALVLTHDVEGVLGLNRVRQLAELEMELGFRSAFNLVPEGAYSVPKELREHLVRNGFEIGVHDLNHDGKLYSSREAFLRKASRINHYLKDWNAEGFRSAFMLHNLEWIQDLNIGYDESTFDTDPFEPQPDGANTIFPFWNGSSAGRGYVELPYTLVQDSTLFIFLKEKSPSIWQQKLQWIATRGGMALLNVHPDYTAMNGSSPSPYEYPVALYREFLEWVKREWKGRYWHALPGDVARFYVKSAMGTEESSSARTPASDCVMQARVGGYASSDNGEQATSNFKLNGKAIQ